MWGYATLPLGALTPSRNRRSAGPCLRVTNVHPEGQCTFGVQNQSIVFGVKGLCFQ